MSNEHWQGAGADDVCGLVAAYALGSVTQQEKKAFEEHLGKCTQCQAELQGASEALTSLTDSAPLSHDARTEFIKKIHGTGRPQQPAAIHGTSSEILSANASGNHRSDFILHRSKPDAGGDRNTGVAEAGAQTVSLGIHGADKSVHCCDHIACFWETEKQFEDAVGFLETGIAGEDHSVVFGYDEANERVLEVLGRRGIDVAQLISRQRLSVLTAASTGEATLQHIGATFKKVMDAGAPMIRVLGNIGWNRPNWPQENDILAFEAKLTVAARRFPCVIVCMYDLNSLPGRIVLRGGLETHPVAVRDHAVLKNPFYLSPETSLAQRL